MKQIILGTAGHIDHGKTALIKAISGVETDRLKEEKERGITIELGFASLVLPSGQHLGIVDVPGHEKFIKNMVAGATGIDIVAMVIAADEGVMPQTKEHMEICTLLGVKHGLVVLSKVDLVDQEWLELVTEDIRDFTVGTFLEDRPVVPVSSLSGEGIPELLKTLDDLSAEIPSRQSAGIFRLPVDRVFTMKGFGTVITGTLISGLTHVGDVVMLYPSRVSSKVRGLQVHNRNVDQAQAGMRTAINFQGLEKIAVNRGDVIAGRDALKTSYMVDVSLHFLKSNPKPIKNRTLVRFHTSTSEILGHLILLDREELSPDQSAAVQIRLNAPVAVVRDDRFVIRSYSPVRTIGGGQILNPIPRKHKRFIPKVVEGLTALSKSSPADVISHHAHESGYRGVSFSDLMIMTNLPEKELQKVIQELLSTHTLIQSDKENRTYIHALTLEKLKKDVAGNLGNYHHANPLKGGMPKEELKSKFPPTLGVKLYHLILNHLSKHREIVVAEDTLRLSTHKIALKGDQADLRQKIISVYRTGGLQPPYFKEIRQDLGIDPGSAKDVLMLLVDEGQLVKVKEDLYFSAEAVAELKQKLTDFLIRHTEISTPQFKEMTGASRKFVIPLIEHFDAANVTIRIGDIRKLRSR